MNGPAATDAISGKKMGKFETQIAYYMSGPQPLKFPGMMLDARAAHFVGQRLLIRTARVGQAFYARPIFRRILVLQCHALRRPRDDRLLVFAGTAR